MLPRRSFLYRFIALTLVFAIFGVAIFVPLLSGVKEGADHLPYLIALAVYGGVYVLTMVVNEVIVFRKKRKNREKDDPVSEE